MGFDGSLSLSVPRRRLQWRWRLPGSGDPASLALHLAPFASGPLATGSASVGDALLRCLSAATSAPPAPEAGLAPIQQALPAAPMEGLLLASTQALVDPAGVAVSPDQPDEAVQFHTRLTLQRWHRGPVWIAIWRCHGPLGWQRRCGPMPLRQFVQRFSAPQRASS